MGNFHKPVRRPGDVIEVLSGSGDPADVTALAHDTASALLDRVRSANNPALVEGVVRYADANGIDDVAELWSASEPGTLPGAMWRVYVLRHTVAGNPAAAGYRFRRGLEIDTVGQALAGAGHMPTPEDVVSLGNEVLKGVFTGDFATALERAAGFARVLAVGSQDLAKAEGIDSDDELQLATGFAKLAEELTSAASLWRAGKLD